VKRSYKLAVGVAAGLLLLKLAVAVGWVMYTYNEADAAQRFTPETVRSVPDSFLKGGDQTLNAINQLNATMRQNGRKLDAIAAKLDQLNANLTRLHKQQ